MKKRVVGYVRISTKDQSNFSLDGQEEAIARHCERNGWELIGISRDEGESAKNFDRASWKELEKYLKTNHRNIDYLVVMKYDRFSRNVSEALVMLKKLEDKYGIRVMSVLEPIGMHPDSPYFFQFRTNMLVGAETELLIIKDRTKFGLRQGALDGRLLTTAPFGFKNARDERNKPILVLDDEKALIAAEVFELYCKGITVAEIGKLLRPKGFTLRGNSSITRMLANPIYAGMVHVPAYYDEPEKMVPAKSPAIISKAVWYQVQALLSGKPQPKVVYNDEVPLRGVVRCFCDRFYTAGNSKGKNRYYWYYKCMSHPKINLRADTLHSQFNEILDELSIDDVQERYIGHYLANKIQAELDNRNEATAEISREIRAVAANIEKVEEKYIMDGLDRETYQKWKGRYQAEREALEMKLIEARGPIEEAWNKYSDLLALLKDLRSLYNNADIHGKQAFVKLVFNNQLSYSEGIYRTPFIIPIFGMKAASLQQKRLLIIEQPLSNVGKIPIGAPGGT